LLDEGDILVEEGEEVEYMSMIFQGQGEIRIDGKQSVLAQIGPGSWVGEMAFFTGELASATVCAAKPTLIIRWEIDQIKKLLQLPGRSYKAQAFAKLPSHFCADLARKVKQYNSIPAMQSFIQSQKETNKHTRLKKFDNKKRDQPMKAGFVSLVSVRRSWVNFFDKENAERVGFNQCARTKRDREFCRLGSSCLTLITLSATSSLHSSLPTHVPSGH